MPGDLIEQSSHIPLVGDGVGGAGRQGVRIGRFALVARHGRLRAPGGCGRGRLLAVIRMGEWR
jgi:hypothetical protein